MQFNVADLLKGPQGATREYVVDEKPNFELIGAECPGHLQGHVTLMRTQQGILVEASLSLMVELTCARCLGPAETKLEVNIAEEFRPTVDVLTGERIYPEPEEFLGDDIMISPQHILDLDEPARQEFEVAIPLKPLCSEACAGLCPICGQNLNEGPCNCLHESDLRWEALRHLLDEGATQ